MKTFYEFRKKINESASLMEGRFLTIADCRKAYHEGVKDGSIGLCGNCGSPNLTERDGESRTCVDCGHKGEDWRINEDEIEEEGGAGVSSVGAPTNNMGSGQIPGANIPAGSHFGEPGVPIRKKFKLMNGPPVDPRMFGDKIFQHSNKAEEMHEDEGSNEELASILHKHGAQYGSPDEKVRHLTPTVSVHSKKEWGNHRFVKHDGHGNPIAAVQVVSREKGKGHVSTAYTHPDHRRQGHAAELIRHAKKQFPHLTYSEHRSENGKALVNKAEEMHEDEDQSRDDSGKWKTNTRQPPKPLIEFTVYISKTYFPKELHPPGKMNDVFEQWKEKATSRSNAAYKIWAQHGPRLLSLMLPHPGKLPRKVSLNVNSPKAGVGGIAGRLSTIVVYPTESRYQNAFTS
jgi:GNAT superfamily N-acetyltransferase